MFKLSSVNRYELSKFNWDKHFVWSKDGNKCLGACALMAVRYWDVEVSNDRCQEIIDHLPVPAFEGPDAKQVLKAVDEVIGVTAETEVAMLEPRIEDFIDSGSFTTLAPRRIQPSLKQDFFHAKSIEVLKACFHITPAIPQIVIYDDIMANYNEESPGGHASLVHSLDFQSRFVYLIDPNVQARRSPVYLSFDDFTRGWKSFEQATIVLYPTSLYKTVRSLTTMTGLEGI